FADGELVRLEVDVRPGEPEDLATAKTRTRRKLDHRTALDAGRSEYAIDLLVCRRGGLLRPSAVPTDPSGHVSLELAVLNQRSEDARQEPDDLSYRARRHAPTSQRRGERLDLGASNCRYELIAEGRQQVLSERRPVVSHGV